MLPVCARGTACPLRERSLAAGIIAVAKGRTHSPPVGCVVTSGAAPVPVWSARSGHCHFRQSIYDKPWLWTAWDQESLLIPQPGKRLHCSRLCRWPKAPRQPTRF